MVTIRKSGHAVQGSECQPGIGWVGAGSPALLLGTCVALSRPLPLHLLLPQQ